MKRNIPAVACVVGLFLSAFAGVAAAGQSEVDVATITCKDIQSSKQDEASLIMMWIHGYFGGKADDTTINFDAFTKGAEELGKYCTDHPDIGLLTAAKTVFGG